MNKQFVFLITLFFSALFFSAGTSAQNNEDANLGATPPMGWNSWNWWGKDPINEQLIRETIDAIVETGLRDAGYEYVVVDGGWRDTKLNEKGELVAHPTKFPSGMKALADYAHCKGLKFGLHTVPGSHDCGGDMVGAWGLEQVHVQQFIDWGIDFIKLDRCKFWTELDIPENERGKDWKSGWEKGTSLVDAYSTWRALLDKSPHPIVLSASAYQYYDWYPMFTQMGRTTGDILSKQSKQSDSGAQFDTGHKRSVMAIADRNNQYADKAGNGYWNDPDMLVTGDQGLTLDQQKVHFALWCIMSSPLFLGNNPLNMSNDELSIITNKYAISVNQDPTEQGRRVFKDGDVEIWIKKLKDNQHAVLLFNRGTTDSKEINLNFKKFGLDKKQQLFNIWEKDDLGKYNGDYRATVKPTSAQFLLLQTLK